MGAMAASTTTPVVFRAAADAEGAAPLLEGRLRRPGAGQALARAAVLAHPHPAFGGDMDGWLLPAIGARLAEEGWAVLRFNVRGVGGSHAGPGRWDGSSEHLDLAGAVDHVLGHVRAADRVALVGWSFGALLGLLHGPADPRVTDWVGIAPPTRPIEGVPMVPADPAALRRWPARRAVIVGTAEQYFPHATLGRLEPHEVRLVDGADHFFFDRDREIADLVAELLR
jgi:alpha/beta superfamily hydrolase